MVPAGDGADLTDAGRICRAQGAGAGPGPCGRPDSAPSGAPGAVGGRPARRPIDVHGPPRRPGPLPAPARPVGPRGRPDDRGGSSTPRGRRRPDVPPGAARGAVRGRRRLASGVAAPLGRTLVRDGAPARPAREPRPRPARRASSSKGSPRPRGPLRRVVASGGRGAQPDRRRFGSATGARTTGRPATGPGSPAHRRSTSGPPRRPGGPSGPSRRTAPARDDPRRLQPRA